MEKVLTSREKENASKAEEDKLKQDKIERKKEKDKQYRRDKRQQISADKKAGAGSQQDNKDTFAKPMAPAPSSSKVVAPPPGFPGAKKSVPPPPGFSESRKRSVAPPPGFKEPDQKKQKVDDYDQLSEEEQKKLRTVFISNLGFSVNEDDLKTCLETSGTILDVRLVKKPTGESKGYAFVEFDNYTDALEALKRDNELLSGRPMYVSECDPER